MPRTWPLYLAVMALGLAAGFLFLYGLGARPLQDYDEAAYGLITHQMAASVEWVSPAFMGHPFFEKPPLYFWLSAALEKTFGQSELMLRLPSALAGIGLVVLVMLLTYELSGSLGAGVFAGAVELTMAPVLETARQARLDVLVAFFIVLAAYGFVRGLRDSRWFLVFGVAAGLAVMTKSIVAVFAFIAAAAYLFLLSPRRKHIFREKYFWYAAGVFLLVALPWHLWETIRYGAAFWNVYIGFIILERVSSDLFPIPVSNYDYIWYLSRFAAPWAQAFLLGILGLVVFWKHIDARLRAAAAASALAVFAVIAIFFSSATKAPTYLLPLYPFAAAAIALFFLALARTRTVLATGAAAFLLTIGFFVTVYDGFHLNPYYAPADALAREEKNIGTMLAEDPSRTVFAYAAPPLGSIMYYSGNTHPLALINPPAAGSYIVLPTNERPNLYKQYPQISTYLVYEGQDLILLKVLSED